MELEMHSLALPATSQQGDSYRPIGLPNIDIFQASKRRLSQTQFRARVLKVCRQFWIITAAISTDATSPDWRRKQLAWPPKPTFPRPTTARESPFTTNCASRSEWSTRPRCSPDSRRCGQLLRSIAAWAAEENLTCGGGTIPRRTGRPRARSRPGSGWYSRDPDLDCGSPRPGIAGNAKILSGLLGLGKLHHRTK
jgi:hypothetical protein